ncbi:MAG: hypothetical protein IPH68_16070 [Chitinophagaceae bacterium]|nr:hypothetical protein [Chitinophagaceae bacterium]
MIKTFLITLSLYFMLLMAGAQNRSPEFPFDLRLDVMEINGLPALQSYAYATWQGKWLLVGGRKDGLHRRQPWATFDEDGQNKFIYVVDPVKNRSGKVHWKITRSYKRTIAKYQYGVYTVWQQADTGRRIWIQQYRR